MQARLWQIISIIFAMGLWACGGATSTQNLGQPCESERDCRAGQACLVTASHEAMAAWVAHTPYVFMGSETTEPTEPGAATCQIPCRSNTDCPDAYVCYQDDPSNVDLTAICVPEEWEQEQSGS